MLAPVLVLATPALGAADPTPPVVTVGREGRRRGSGHWIRLEAPDGLKLDEDSPVELALIVGGREVTASLPADAFVPGLSVGDLGVDEVDGTVRTVLCEVQTNICRRSEWRVRGPSPRRGAAQLRVTPPEPESRFGPASDTGAVSAAFEAAKQSGEPVLLDFSAVWCPPCTQLAAEVLDADPPPIVLDGFHVAVVDVDHPSSFGLKDRYEVGGYPTSLVVEPDGTVRARMVGYPGREAYLDWLAEAASAQTPEPDALTPVEAARVAVARIRAGDEAEARRFLDSAVARGFDGADRRVVAARLAPSAADVAWLLDHAPERLVEVRYALMELDDAGLVDRALAVLEREATGEPLVDVFAIRAHALRERGDEAGARRAAGIAANLLGGLTEGASGKAYLGWRADLWAQAGHLERAVAVLEGASERYPDEPTFDLALARILVEAERPAEALVAAERAAARSWGDIALRVAVWHGRALVALERRDEARAMVQAVLAPTDDLDPDTAVRTHRYRQRLADWWASVEAP